MEQDIWTKDFVVVLQIKADVPIGTYPEWWEVLDLPPPWKWNEHFPQNTHVEEIFGKELM